MDRTVAHLNIEYYRRLLGTETDEERRRLLFRLLAEEEAKLSPQKTLKADSDQTNAPAPTAANVSGAHPAAPASSRLPSH